MMRKPVTIMGIINLSPDSFCGENRCETESEALKTAERLLKEGADQLDVGAESSRPGSRAIPEDVEIRRLVPVVSVLARKFEVPISVDTYKPEVAQRVLEAGAVWINDITGLQGRPQMAGLIARHGAGAVIMHMKGVPANMQDHPQYEDLVGEILGFLQKSLEIARSAGIAEDRIVIDPGIGFGKTPEHNLELIRCLDRFRVLNKPILLGASRKSFIGQVLDLPVEDRLEGSLAAAILGVMNGASILRVHDVRATVRAVAMAQAIMGGQNG